MIEKKRTQLQKLAALIIFLTQRSVRNDKPVGAFRIVGSQSQLQLFLSRSIVVVTQLPFWDLCVLVQSRQCYKNLADRNTRMVGPRSSSVFAHTCVEYQMLQTEIKSATVINRWAS